MIKLKNILLEQVMDPMAGYVSYHYGETIKRNLRIAKEHNKEYDEYIKKEPDWIKRYANQEAIFPAVAEGFNPTKVNKTDKYLSNLLEDLTRAEAGTIRKSKCEDFPTYIASLYKILTNGKPSFKDPNGKDVEVNVCIPTETESYNWKQNSFNVLYEKQSIPVTCTSSGQIIWDSSKHKSSGKNREFDIEKLMDSFRWYMYYTFNDNKFSLKWENVSRKKLGVKLDKLGQIEYMLPNLEEFANFGSFGRFETKIKPTKTTSLLSQLIGSGTMRVMDERSTKAYMYGKKVTHTGDKNVLFNVNNDYSGSSVLFTLKNKQQFLYCKLSGLYFLYKIIVPIKKYAYRQNPYPGSSIGVR